MKGKLAYAEDFAFRNDELNWFNFARQQYINEISGIDTDPSVNPSTTPRTAAWMALMAEVCSSSGGDVTMVTPWTPGPQDMTIRKTLHARKRFT